MSYVIYPLQFDTAVHFAQAGRGGRLDEAGTEYGADALFSALCAELAATGEMDALAHLHERVAARELLFSDLLPWRVDAVGEMEFYVPRPVLRIEGTGEARANFVETCSRATERKKQKSMKYLRASCMADYVDAMRTGAPFSSAAEFGTASLRQRVNTREAEPLPYYVGQFDFHRDAGLYLLAYVHHAEDADFLRELLIWLGLSGIGGKRTSGFGKFHIAEDEIVLDADGIYADDAALYALLHAADAPWQMTIAPVVPAAEELPRVKDGAYRLRRTGGFITAPAHEAEKKNSIYLIDAGSCLRTRIGGSLAELCRYDGHPVWRYGFGLYLGVTA